MSAIDRYRATTTEAELLAAFRDLARATGGASFHIRRAQGQEIEGLTDVVLIVPPVVAFFELKTQGDRVSLRQHQVLDLLARCHVVVSGIIRPNPKPGELSLDEALELLR